MCIFVPKERNRKTELTVLGADYLEKQPWVLKADVGASYKDEEPAQIIFGT